jgi:hypothetical protein
MANFFPLIINPVGNSIQELPATDFLDLSQSGIANSGNITVSGVISATGNISGANINGAHFGSGAGLSSITGANVTGTVPSATSATTAGTVTTAAQPNITSVGTLSALSVTGNITGGNLILSGAIVDSAQLDIQTSAANANIVLTPNGTGNVNIGRMSASGNITAVAYYGSGASLTSISATNISSGTLAQARLANAAVTLGSTALTLGATVTTVAGLSSVTSTTFVGALTGAATTAGTVTTAAQPNITSVGTLSSLAVTGNITAGNVSATLFTGTATQARYADLAEMYAADANYAPGTVLIFGGNNEVTVSTGDAQTQVAGVVSTNAAHIMNTGISAEYPVTLALAGRVPTKVYGPVKKGDMMVSAADGYARACATPAMCTVIGKALEEFNGTTGVIEVVINNM